MSEPPRLWDSILAPPEWLEGGYACDSTPSSSVLSCPPGNFHIFLIPIPTPPDPSFLETSQCFIVIFKIFFQSAHVSLVSEN